MAAHAPRLSLARARFPREAIVSRRRIASLDVLGQVRRAMRILRRVELYLVQQERATKRAEKRAATFNAQRPRAGDALGVADQP